jgi:hypothetical protein
MDITGSEFDGFDENAIDDLDDRAFDLTSLIKLVRFNHFNIIHGTVNKGIEIIHVDQIIVKCHGTIESGG